LLVKKRKRRGKEREKKRFFIICIKKIKKILIFSKNQCIINSNSNYLNIPLPKFVWVCEISTLSEYKNNKIIGEIVLDATASKYDKLESAILIRYQQKFGFKLSNETILKLKERLRSRRKIFSQSYSKFNKNLKEIKNV